MFTLDRVERDWVDPDHSRAPKGTWVRIPVTVRNAGDTAQTFAASDQKLTEPGGNAYTRLRTNLGSPVATEAGGSLRLAGGDRGRWSASSMRRMLP